MNPWPRSWWARVALALWISPVALVGAACWAWSRATGRVRTRAQDGALEVAPVSPGANGWVERAGKRAICIWPFIFYSWSGWNLPMDAWMRLQAHERLGHGRQVLVFGPFSLIFVALGHLGYGARQSPLEVHARDAADEYMYRETWSGPEGR